VITKEKAMDTKKILLMGSLLFALNAYAQDAPPIAAGGFVCDVDRSFPTIEGCEAANTNALVTELQFREYNGELCYTGVSYDTTPTLTRRWLDSTRVVVAGNYWRFVYETGVFIGGTQAQTNVPYGQQPCWWILPVLEDPLSMVPIDSSGNGREYIGETSSLACPANTTAYDTGTFVCYCPNATYWNGDPWGDVPVPGFEPSCAVPPITDNNGPSVAFTVNCVSGGLCYPDNRAMFVVQAGPPTVGVTFPLGATVEKLFVTLGCCQRVPVTWYSIHRSFYPPCCMQGKVPAGPGQLVQIHYQFKTSPAVASATYTVSVRH
jgi:hypothetical protein